ncbi:MAG: hypothetical protein JWQ73_639 [Variovorax sp.]|nr:hypothetical protein [Variovorax sp.]
MRGAIAAPRGPRTPGSARTFQKVLVLLPLALTILLAKFSMPPFSTMGLGIALPLVFLVTFVGLLFGAFKVHLGRLCFYLLLAIWVCVSQLFGKSFSLSSLCFLLFIFFPYVLQLKGDRATPDAAASTPAEIFTNVGFAAAILGCVQYGAQFVIGPTLAFPIEHLLPKGILIEYFNYLNAVSYGSSVYKANGVFFLEPSFFSQFLAISLLVELSGKTRLLRIAAHLAALACTFSGTGLIVLATGAVTLVVVNRRWDLAALALFVGLIGAFFGQSLGLGYFVERSSEFASVGTSGFERFVAWTYLLRDQFWDATSKVWTGFGAGTFAGEAKVARYSVWESSFAKIIFEFGLPGIVLYCTFIIYCIKTSAIATPVKVGLVTCIFMNGAYSETSAGILLTLALWPPASRIASEVQAKRIDAAAAAAAAAEKSRTGYEPMVNS